MIGFFHQPERKASLMFVESVERVAVIDGEEMRVARVDVAECPDCGERRVWDGVGFGCGRGCGADPLGLGDVYVEWNERAFMAENGVLCVAVYEVV